MAQKKKIVYEIRQAVVQINRDLTQKKKLLAKQMKMMMLEVANTTEKLWISFGKGSLYAWR